MITESTTTNTVQTQPSTLPSLMSDMNPNYIQCRPQHSAPSYSILQPSGTPLSSSPRFDCPTDPYGKIFGSIGTFVGQLVSLFRSSKSDPSSTTTPPAPLPGGGTQVTGAPVLTGGLSQTAPSSTTTPTPTPAPDSAVTALIEKFSAILDSIMDRLASLEKQIVGRKGSKKKSLNGA